MNSMTLEITKSGRRWHIHTAFHYDKWPNAAHTHTGASTLASALWDTLSEHRNSVTGAPEPFTVESVTVRGKIMPLPEVLERIEKRLTGTGLDYTLPYYRKLLAS